MRPVELGSAALASLAMILSLVGVGTARPRHSGFMVNVAERVGLCGSGERDTIVAVVSGVGLTLNERPIERRQLSRDLTAIFNNRVERVVYVKAGLDLPFQDVATLIGDVAPHCDVVALITPATDSREGCLTLTLPVQTR